MRAKECDAYAAYFKCQKTIRPHGGLLQVIRSAAGLSPGLVSSGVRP